MFQLILILIVVPVVLSWAFVRGAEKRQDRRMAAELQRQRPA